MRPISRRAVPAIGRPVAKKGNASPRIVIPTTTLTCHGKYQTRGRYHHLPEGAFSYPSARSSRSSPKNPAVPSFGRYHPPVKRGKGVKQGLGEAAAGSGVEHL
jgi:hypothetical protein